MIAIDNLITIHLDAPETRLVGVPPGQLEEGRDKLEIRCIANANPTASILWKRTRGTDMEVVTIGETLMYSPIHRNHAATYVCDASNSEGESSPLSIQISVNCEFLIRLKHTFLSHGL